jgi:uncharacterized protein DUF4265
VCGTCGSTHEGEHMDAKHGNKGGDASGHVRVYFDLEKDPDDGGPPWPPYDVEWIWATQVGPDRYRLDNVPFYARGISCGDVVEATTAYASGQGLAFKSVVNRSGHSTFRIMISGTRRADNAELFDACIASLRALGCTFEKASDVLWALDCSINPHWVREVLAIGVEDGLLEVEDGYVATSGWEAPPKEPTPDSGSDIMNLAVTGGERNSAVEAGFTLEKSLPRFAHLEGLKQQLLTIDGWAVVLLDGETHASALQERGELRDGDSAERREMTPSACHSNVSDVYLSDTSLTPWVGYALSADGMWRQHGWLATAQGTLIETTVARVKYFGIPLVGAEALEYAVSNLPDAPNVRERVFAHPDFPAFAEMLRQRKADGVQSRSSNPSDAEKTPRRHVPPAGIRDDTPQVKVVFELAPSNDPAYEAMWSYDLGDGDYMLDNVPIMAYGISLEDIFRCKHSDRDERPYFSHVTKRSRNWTYRLMRSEGLTPEQLERVAELRERIREHATATSLDESNGWYSFNIPDTAGDELDEIVSTGDREGLWESEVSSGPDLEVG